MTCFGTDDLHIQQPQAHTFQPPTTTYQFKMPEISQPTLDLQAAHHSRDFQRNYSQIGHRNAGKLPGYTKDQNEWMAFKAPQSIPPPVIPGRSNSQVFFDARDFLTPEQQQRLMSSNSPQLSPALLDINPFKRSSKSTSEPTCGPLPGPLPDQRSSDDPSDPDAVNIGNASQFTWPPAEDISHELCSKVYQLAEQSENMQGEIGPNSPGIPTGTPYTTTPGYSAIQNSDSQDRPNSFITSPMEAGPSVYPQLINDPFMGYDGNDDELLAVQPPQGRTAIIMDDSYDIYNASVLARVVEECKKGMYQNTPSAIATYHQLAMADDLYYGEIWKGRFMVNESSIIEYHNPAPSRPEVPDHERRDRRQVFAWVQDVSGKTGWCKVVGGNKLVPAVGMKAPPAEYVDVLNLWRYFFNRVPCGDPNVEKIRRARCPPAYRPLL